MNSRFAALFGSISGGLGHMVTWSHAPYVFTCFSVATCVEAGRMRKNFYGGGCRAVG